MRIWLGLVWMLTLAGATKHKTKVAIRNLPSVGDGIPSFSELFGKDNDKGGKTYEIFGCSVENSKDGCVWKFTPDKSCMEKLVLGKIFGKLSDKAGAGGKLERLTKGIFPAGAFSVSKFTLNTCGDDKGLVEFTCENTKPVQFIKPTMKVLSGKLVMKFNYEEVKQHFCFSSFDVDLKGTIELAGQKVSLILKKPMKSHNADFEISAEELSFATFVKLFKKSPEEGGKADKSLKNDFFSKFAIKEPIISGTRNQDGDYEIVVKGKAQGIPGIEEVSGFLVVKKPSDGPTGVGVVASLKKIQPLKIISAIIRKELNVDIIKDLEVDLTIEYASENIKELNNPALGKVLLSSLTSGKHLKKGTVINVNIPIKDILQKIGTPANLENIPKEMAISIMMLEDKVSFKFPPDAFNDGMNILATIAPKAIKMLNKYIFKSNFKIVFQKYDIDIKTKKVHIAASIPGEVTVGIKFFKLKDVVFEIKIDQNTFDFKLDGEIKFGGSISKIFIRKNKNKFDLSGSLSSLTSAQLLEAFGTKKLVDDVMKKSKKMNFGMCDLKITAEFGENLPQEVRIVANPLLFGWEGLKLEAYLFTPSVDVKEETDDAKEEIPITIATRTKKIHKKEERKGNLRSNVVAEEDDTKNYAVAENNTVFSGEEEGDQVLSLSVPVANDTVNVANNNVPVADEGASSGVEILSVSGDDMTQSTESDEARFARDHVEELPENTNDMAGEVTDVDFESNTSPAKLYALVRRKRHIKRHRKTFAKHADMMSPHNDVMVTSRDDVTEENNEEDGRQMAIAVIMQKIGIDNIIKSLFDKTIMGTNWMNQIDLAIVFSNSDKNKFTIPEIKQIVGTPKKGFFLKGKMQIPEDCRESKLCEFAKKKMKPGASFYIDASFQTSGFELTAGYDGEAFDIGNHVQLNNVYFALKVGGTNEFMLKGKLTVKVKPEPIVLEVAIGLTGSAGLKLSASMRGMWHRPLGIPNMAIGNLELHVELQPPLYLPSSMRAGGQMNIGNAERDTIVAKAFGELNMLKPNQNFVYASVTKVTLGYLARAFGHDTTNMPQIILDTGFPEGVLAGFSSNPTGHQIKELGVKLDMGFTLKGKINILGFIVAGKLMVSSRKLLVDVNFSPINVANGAFQITHSMTDLETGPKVFISVGADKAEFKIKGAVQVLGISSQVSVDIGENGIHLSVAGNLFGIIGANLTVKAPYVKGMKIDQAGFTVSGCVSTGFSAATDEANSVVKKAAEDSVDMRNKAEEIVKQKSSWYERFVEKLRAMEGMLNKILNKMQITAAKMEKYDQFIEVECSERCENIDKFFKRKKCQANCVVKKGVYSVKRKTKQIKQATRKSTHDNILPIIQKITSIVERSKGLVDKLQKTANSVQKFTECGLKAARDMAQKISKNVIEIHYACFETSLEKAANACFGVKANITLLGKTNKVVDVETCFDVSFLKTMGKAVSDQLYPGVSLLKEKLQQAKEKFKETKKEEKDIDNDDNESEDEFAAVEEDIKSSTEDDDDNDDDEDEDEVEDEEEEGEDEEEEGEEEQEDKKGRRKASHHHAKKATKTFTMEAMTRQIYNDLPSSLMESQDVLDALDVSPDYLQETYRNQAVKDLDISDLLSTTKLESKNPCHVTRSLTETYARLSGHLRSHIQLLDDVISQTNSSGVEMSNEFRKLKTFAVNKCKASKAPSIYQQDVLDLVQQLSQAHSTRMQNLDADLSKARSRLFARTRVSLANQIRSKAGISVQGFLGMLKQATQSVSRDINKNVDLHLHASFNAVDKLLSEHTGDKVASLHKLDTSTDYLKRNHIACAA